MNINKSVCNNGTIKTMVCKWPTIETIPNHIIEFLNVCTPDSTQKPCGRDSKVIWFEFSHVVLRMQQELLAISCNFKLSRFQVKLGSSVTNVQLQTSNTTSARCVPQCITSLCLIDHTYPLRRKDIIEFSVSAHPA